MRSRLTFALLPLTLCTCQVMVASAQGLGAPTSPSIIVDEDAPKEAKAVVPALTLEDCLEIGYQRQPALNAARASLSATQAGKQAVDRMKLATVFARDLTVRRKQACYGVTIAEAALSQAEWETRYAITRNFFTVQYVRSQQVVIADVLRSLENGYKRAKKIYDGGAADSKITKVDLDSIEVNMAMVRGRKAQADNGLEKAFAALREAMGVNCDFTFDIVAVDLPLATYKVERPDPSDKDKKKVIIDYVPLYQLDKNDLIASAMVNRGEITQANAANRVTQLEIQAQLKMWGFQGRTFAQASDIHAQPIPPSLFNGDYRPGGTYPDYPTMFAGRRRDRENRAVFLDQRMAAVREKTENLVSLDVEAQFLKWRESLEDIRQLQSIYSTAQKLPDQLMKIMEAREKDLTGFAIIHANMTSIQVRTQLNEELHNHALALAGLERATAGGFRVYPIPCPPPAVLPK